MQKSAKYRQALAFACVVGIPVVAAQASRLGHPGVSTKGATASATQWNIICDPAYATIGSDTTAYSTNASISEVDSIYPYQVQSVTVVLSGVNTVYSETAKITKPPVDQNGNKNISYQTYYPTDGTVYIDPDTFGSKHEVGEVQVKWKIAPGQTAPSSGDDDTHLLTFNQSSTSDNPTAVFTDKLMYYGTGANVPSPDYYSGVGPPPSNTPFTYSSDPHSPYYVSNVQTNSVKITLLPDEGGEGGEVARNGLSPKAAGAPEPGSIGLAVVVSGLGLLRRRRAV